MSALTVQGLYGVEHIQVDPCAKVLAQPTEDDDLDVLLQLAHDLGELAPHVKVLRAQARRKDREGGHVVSDWKSGEGGRGGKSGPAGRGGGGIGRTTALPRLGLLKAMKPTRLSSLLVTSKFASSIIVTTLAFPPLLSSSPFATSCAVAVVSFRGGS